MVGEVDLNLTELVSEIIPQLIGSFGWLSTVLKAIGVVAILYVFYLAFVTYLNFRKIKKLKHIEKKVDSIDRKLDILLKEKKKKRK